MRQKLKEAKNRRIIDAFDGHRIKFIVLADSVNLKNLNTKDEHKSYIKNIERY